MSKNQKSYRFISRVALSIIIGAVALTLTSAGANAAGFSFMDSVKEFFGIEPTQMSALAAKPGALVNSPAVDVLAPDAVTLSWNTFGNLGTETTEPSTANDPNVASANLTLGAGVTAAANGNRFGGSNWFDVGNTVAGNTVAEAVAGNNYIQFIVTPNAGFSFTPTSFVFNWDRSATGPPNVALRSSADGFANDLGSVTGIVAATFATNTITISGLTNVTSATTFRIYGYGATATGGTGGFDIGSSVVNVTLNGTTAATAPTQFLLTVTPAGTGTGTVTSNVAGINCPGDCSENYNSGTPVTLTATQNGGSTFTGWSGACSGTGTCNVTMNSATNVTATFDLAAPTQFLLTTSTNGTGTGTITSNPSGINCPGDCTENYNSGTPVGLTATQNAGSVFAGWGGACSGTGTCNVTMNSAMSVSATFNLSAPPSFAVNDIQNPETNSGQTPFAFTVTKTGGNGNDSYVYFNTSDGSATLADNDYQQVLGPNFLRPEGIQCIESPNPGYNCIHFLPGDTSKPFPVLVNGDTNIELNETFNLNIAFIFNGSGVSNKGIGTIVNDDFPPSISITNVSHNEGNAGTTSYIFDVTLSGPTTGASVQFTTQDVTATVANNDYIPNPAPPIAEVAGLGTISWTSVSPLTQQVTVLVVGDLTVEPDETFKVHLSNPINATISNADGIGTIVNDDTPPPSFAVNDISINEGNSGTTSFTFTISKTGGNGAGSTVFFNTADGTATVADNDYQPIVISSRPETAVANFVDFAAGDTSKPVTVLVNGDLFVEGNETFTLHLNGVSNGTISDADGVGNIINDDAVSNITIDDVSHSEGNSGTTAFVFTVTLSAAPISTASVQYVVQDGSATTADSDYQAASGTVNWTSSGSLTQQITVLVNGDTKYESSAEQFTVQLSNAVNATITDAAGSGTIFDDDSPPTFSVNDVSANEGNSGTTPFTFTITKNGTTAFGTTVFFNTVDGTATVANNDYQPLGNQPRPEGDCNPNVCVFFLPGDTTKPVTVLVNGDVAVEPTETFTLHITPPGSGLARGIEAGVNGVGTIVNDDSPPAAVINDVSQFEGNSGTTAFTFSVTLAQAPTSTATIQYTTGDGTATLANNDYQAANGTLTWTPSGPLTQQFTVLGNGDTTFEVDEAFIVTLSNPINTTIGDGTGVGTIKNDDCTPPPSGMVAWYIAEGNANDNAGSNNGTLQNGAGFDVGEVGQAFLVNGVNQYVSAPDSAALRPANVSVDGWFNFSSAPTNVTLVAKPFSTGSLDSYAIYIEGGLLKAQVSNGTTSAVANSIFTPVPGVWYMIAMTFDDNTNLLNLYVDGSVAASTTYASSLAFDSSPFLMGADLVSGTPAQFFNGHIDEVEVFTRALTQSEVFGIVFAGTAGKCRIPIIQFSSTAYAEDEGQNAGIAFTRNGDVSGTSTAFYSTIPGGTAVGGSSCTAGVDYITVTNAAFTFNPGEFSKTAPVQLCSDGLIEANETVNVRLTGANPPAVLGGLVNAVLTINDTASAFTNLNEITLFTGSAANPYPSSIVVSGAPPVIGNLRVTLFDARFDNSPNVDVLLVGPGGQQFILQGDAGSPLPMVNPVTITFSDSPNQVLPCGAPLFAGPFRPTTCTPGQSAFPSPAPAPNPGPLYNEPGSSTGPRTPLQKLIGVYGGTNPNGVWRIFFRDDAGARPFQPSAINGVVAGWGIQFFAPTAAPATLGGRIMTAGGQGIRNAIVTVSGGSLTEPRVVQTSSFGWFNVEGLTAGETYVVTVNAKRFTFNVPSRVVTLTDNVADMDFISDQ